jgi:hypothetical protein
MKKSFIKAVGLVASAVVIASCEPEAELLPTNASPNESGLLQTDNATLADGPILLNANPGFESGLNQWSIYQAPSIANQAIVRVDENGQAKFGSKHLFMRLPASATNNQTEYITVGQTLSLSSKKRYKYSVQVRWANAGNALPSAIVSTWALNPDKSYNGKDHWIMDGNGYKNLSFEFTPNESGEVFCYISLLTHQDGFDDTDILVDALRIEEIGDAAADKDPRPAGTNLLQNSSFDQDFDGWIPTYYNPNNVSGLNRSIVSINTDKKMRLELPGASNNTFLNNTWTGVYQSVTLYQGNTYQISANVDRITPNGVQYPTIVNLYAYKPATNQSGEAWVGSVDYKFNRADDHLYSKTISPTETTTYHITARVFGWGQDGRPVGIDLDDIEVTRVE